MASSRRYIKRIWRVPKTRGPVEYLATLIVKALVKHGWPALWVASQDDEWAFEIHHDTFGSRHPPDFATAVEIAGRIIARTYRVEDGVSQSGPVFLLERPYIVTPRGDFKEVKS